MARSRTNFPRRRKQWLQLPGISANLTVAGTTGGSLQAFAGGGNTVLRCMGQHMLMGEPGATHVIGDTMTFTWAIGVVSSDAAAAGAGSLPDPADEPEYPWLYWHTDQLVFTQTGTSTGEGSAVVRTDFDIKSMRKISPRESLIFFGQYVDISGTPSVRIEAGPVRVLVALP